VEEEKVDSIEEEKVKDCYDFQVNEHEIGYDSKQENVQYEKERTKACLEAREYETVKQKARGTVWEKKD
jgi:hypothetical protein